MIKSIAKGIFWTAAAILCLYFLPDILLAGLSLVKIVLGINLVLFVGHAIYSALFSSSNKEVATNDAQGTNQPAQ